MTNRIPCAAYCLFAFATALSLPTAVIAQGTVVSREFGAGSDLGPPPTPVLIVPGTQTPAQRSSNILIGPPSYRPRLRAETPAEQVARVPAQPITTFEEALERSYWTNPQLLAERARTRSADFRLPQARGQYGPELQYSADYAYQRDTFEQSIGRPLERAGWTSTASAVVSLPLFTFGRLRANENAARAQIAFQHGALAAAEQRTLLDVIVAYVTVLQNRAGVAISRGNVDLLAREFGDTGTRLKMRDSTVAELQQVRARLELARAQLLAAQGAAASSDANFLRLVGAPAGNLSAPNLQPISPRTLEDAYAYADVNNPILASAHARERISRSELQLARAELLPRIDLRGQGLLGTATPYSNNLRQTELRGGITISGFIDSGVRQARIGEAAAANDADWHLIADAIRENRAELADAWNTWQSQVAAIERLNIAVAAAEQALEGALVQQRAGLRTTTEILDLARDLLQVRTSLNSALASSLVQHARALVAMGALRHDLLLPGTPAYDPTRHYERVKGNADVPVLTPMLRTLDSLAVPPWLDRVVRDPAGPLATAAATLDWTSARVQE